MMAGGGGAGTVACPEAGSRRRRRERRLRLRRGCAGDVENREAGLLEPAAEVLLFVLTLGVEEAADRYDSVALEAGVGGEDHVG